MTKCAPKNAGLTPKNSLFSDCSTLISHFVLSVEERNLSHGQLGTKNATRTERSVAEPEQNPENNIGLSRNTADSNRNNREDQDLNQDQEEKSDEQWDSEKKSQEQCD